MTNDLKTIVLEFEADLLRGVRGGADEGDLTKIRDHAFDRLLEVKGGKSPPPLETFFDVAGEICLKLDMALKVIES